MRILLLGGSGLLGHNVLQRLVDEGHDVVVFVRRSGACRLASASWTEYVGSLLDEQDLLRAARGCEAIINCAGITDMSLLCLDDYRPVNRDLCTLLVRLMDSTGIKRLVHVSSANTIGYGTALTPANEDMPMQEPFASSFYAQSKREGEQLLIEDAAAHSERHIVIVNPGFIIGSHDVKPSSGQLLLAAYRKRVMFAPSGGKSFVAASAAAVAVVNALTMGRSGQRYLLTGDNLSLTDFYALQASVCGYRQKIFSAPNWLMRLGGRCGDLLRALGIKTQVSTRNVRQLLVREYYDNGLAVRELHLPQTPTEEAIRDFFDWYTAR